MSRLRLLAVSYPRPKSEEDKVSEHGENRTYLAGCRCWHCRDAHAQYEANRVRVRNRLDTKSYQYERDKYLERSGQMGNTYLERHEARRLTEQHATECLEQQRSGNEGGLGFIENNSLPLLGISSYSKMFLRKGVNT